MLSTIESGIDPDGESVGLPTVSSIVDRYGLCRITVRAWESIYNQGGAFLKHERPECFDIEGIDQVVSSIGANKPHMWSDQTSLLL